MSKLNNIGAAMSVWTDEMKRAAMADARTVVEQAKRIAELEAQISAIHASTRRMTFAEEWYLNGLRHGPGDYVLMRVGPVPKDYEHTF